jgi:hypothetical protein
MNMRPLLLLCSLAVVGVAQAQVYRWVDKDGKVHYSQQKPADAKAQELNIASAPSRATPPTPPAGGTAPTANNDAPPATENDPVRAQIDKLNKERCETAKSVQMRYQGAPYLERTVDGQKVRLSVEEEAAERIRVQQAVTEACAPPAN